MADSSSSVQVQVEPNTARLGDELTLTVRVNAAPGIVVEPPAFEKSLGTFEVRTGTALPVEVQGAQTISRFQATLQNFTTGPQLLPPIAIQTRDADNRTSTLKTSSLTITIQDVPPDPKTKGDIHGIIGVLGPTAWSPLWWLVAAFLLSALCFLLWRKRQRARVGPPPPPPIPADIDALEKLEKLRMSGLLESGKLKEFYSGMSDIVRGYIERAFAVPALERTTNELMRDVSRKNDFTVDLKQSLRDLLESCDLVKFAKFRPTAEEAVKDHEAAVQFIEKAREANHPV